MKLRPGDVVVLPEGVDMEYVSSGNPGNVIMKFTAISPEGLSFLMAQFYERSLGDEFREAVRSAIEKR